MPKHSKPAETPTTNEDAPRNGVRYVGAGAYVAGVPACDLTAAQVAECGHTVTELVAFSSGGAPVYVLAEEE